MDIDDMGYEGEEIKLDKIRHIKYTLKGLKIIAKKFGSVVKAFNDMQKMNQDFDVETMDNLTLLLYAGMVHEDSKLTLDDTENMLTITNMPIAFQKIITAFNESTPKPNEETEVSEVTEGEQK